MVVLERKADAEAARLPLLRMVTSSGDLLLELETVRAPQSSAAFLKEVAAGTYNGARFYRLVRADNDQGSPMIDVVQVGNANVRPAVNDLPLEATGATGLRHLHGSLSLPRAVGFPGTAAQLFICIGDQPSLDAGGGRIEDGLGFAVFGRVVEGMDVVEAIHAGQTIEHAPVGYLHGQVALDPAVVYSITHECDRPSARLAQLAAEYWRFRVHEFPIEASVAGIESAKAYLDGAAQADLARQVRVAAMMLKRAEALDDTAINADEALTLSLLKGQLRGLVEAYALEEHLRPRLFPFGFANVFDHLCQNTAFDRLGDRDDFAARLDALPQFFEQNLALMREGFARGYRIPRVILPRIVALLDHLLSPDGPSAMVKRRLDVAIAGAPPERLEEQREKIAAIVSEAVLPAIQVVRNVIAALDDDHLTDRIGLLDQPDGAAYYRFKLREQTSLDLEPAQIHSIGLDEVARLQVELDALCVEIGRPGERDVIAAEFAARAAPDAASLLERVRACAKQIDGLLPPLFGRLPGITYAVQQMEPHASAALPPALAQPGPANRTMPGVYWLTALPEKCPLNLIVPLTLHEAWPGHLMQFAIAQELSDLPAFRRYGSLSYNGYIEGWALYSERLGEDMGLYAEYADRFGRLTFELWRASRLVVDTGIHWAGWSRENAVAYLSANCFLPASTIESEIDRYIGMPAQALSYKLGERTITSLRAQAETALGENFSLRDFHDAVLATGPISLSALEQHMLHWIEEQKS